MIWFAVIQFGIVDNRVFRRQGCGIEQLRQDRWVRRTETFRHIVCTNPVLGDPPD